MTTTTTRETQRRPRIDLGVAYGMIGGSGVGTLLLALTGDVMWVGICPGVGLLIGLLIASFASGRKVDEEQD